MLADACTLDTLWGGTLALYQPAPGLGYRFNVDAVLLAQFASQSPARSALDLGSGVGAVGLSLLHLNAAKRVTLVDHEARYLEFATRSIAERGWAEFAHCVWSPVEALALPERFDLVVSNPPYTEPGHGRPPKAGSARQGALLPFVQAARAHMGMRAKFVCVYPARDLEHLLSCLRQCGLVAKRMQFVHAHSGADARIVMVEAMAAKAGGLKVCPPIVESA